jgi:hypothetical protein
VPARVSIFVPLLSEASEDHTGVLADRLTFTVDIHFMYLHMHKFGPR